MTLQEIINVLELSCLTKDVDFSQLKPSCGYASDLLSCVMAGAKNGGVWITLQSHSNVIAVAALLELCAVIITEGARPDEETIAKANDEGVTLLLTNKPTFYVVGKLWEMGLREA